MGPLGVGCWRFVARPDEEFRAVLETGLELGMNLVDTADIYGLGWGGKAFGEAEENLGRILAAAPHLWTGIGRARSGAGAAIVGDPDEVVAKLQAYRNVGIDAFILSGYPHLDECNRVGRGVLPRLDHGHLARPDSV